MSKKSKRRKLQPVNEELIASLQERLTFGIIAPIFLIFLELLLAWNIAPVFIREGEKLWATHMGILFLSLPMILLTLIIGGVLAGRRNYHKCDLPRLMRRVLLFPAIIIFLLTGFLLTLR